MVLCFTLMPKGFFLNPILLLDYILMFAFLCKFSKVFDVHFNKIFKIFHFKNFLNI